MNVTLTQFVGDYLMAHDIHSRAEKRDYGVDSHAETDRIVSYGEFGGTRHAVAHIEADSLRLAKGWTAADEAAWEAAASVQSIQASPVWRTFKFKNTWDGGVAAPLIPEWLFWAGLAIAIAALAVAVWFAGMGIGHLLDVAFFAAGQWSASS